MKLSSLLTLITPLPWTFDGSNVISSDDHSVMVNVRSGNNKKWVEQGSLSIQYAMHAANVLPDLVKALHDLSTVAEHCEHFSKGEPYHHLIQQAHSCLTRAKEFKQTI